MIFWEVLSYLLRVSPRPDSRSAGLPLPSEEATRKPRRAMYFNDARHFYLYCYEPPMQLEDAWRPIDEVAGTSVNTFIFGVESGGLFNHTKVGLRWGADQRPFTSAYQWRAWYNMQSLIDRGLDPLQVLIDRAHQRGLEFITSMRISGKTRNPGHKIGVSGAYAGGAGAREDCADFSHQEVRQERFAWLEELAGYPVEGIEMDFAFTPFYFKPEEIKTHAPVMTEFVRSISKMVRAKGKNRIVGARVFPTESMNLSLGWTCELGYRKSWWITWPPCSMASLRSIPICPLRVWQKRHTCRAARSIPSFNLTF